MRIALIGPAHPYKGGGARHTTELAHRLAAAGHDVVIESWRAQYPALLYPGRQTVEVPEGEPYPRTRRDLSWRRPDGWLRTGRRLRRGFDAVVFVFIAPVQVPAYLGILAGLRGTGVAGVRRDGRFAEKTPAVVICHNVLPHERRPGDLQLTRALLRRTGAVLTHSKRLAAEARRLEPAASVQVEALPPHFPAGAAGTGATAAVGSSRCGRASRAGGASLGGVPGRGPRLLFFGIVRPYKGLDVLLRALAAGPPELTLTVAGEFWGGTKATESLIAGLGLTGRVRLRPGYVPAGEVGALLAGADALVLPYRAATASQNVWLAHSHGVPVIATRTGTFEWQVTDGADGLLCEPGNADDLTGALRRFCAPGEKERLRAGVRPVDPEPYWDAYLRTLLSLVAPARG
jgi:glycosyltransferase involved in cell wall biosynthesis